MKQILFLSFIILLTSCKKSSTADPVSTPEIISNVSYGSDPAQKMDLYLPAKRSAEDTKLILFVHGGAWFSGDKSDLEPYLPYLRQSFADYAFANINYRLATETENHFPAQENDMKAAVDFLVQKAGDYRFSKKFILLGVSAGAQMALLQAYKYPSPPVAAVVDFFGPTDLTELYSFYPAGSFNQTVFKVLMNGDPAGNPQLFAQSAPIGFVTSQSPPTLIFHGTADDLVPIGQSISLKNKLDSAGVINQMVSYSNLNHDMWPATTMNDAFDKMKLFLNANVH